MRSLFAVLAVVVAATACTQAPHQAASPATPTPTASGSAVPTEMPSDQPAPVSPSPSASPSVLPAYSPVPSPVGTPVARQVLAPATVMPVASLCSTPLTHDADGNVEPRFCRDGSINVLAWRTYTPDSPNIMGLGRDATVDEVHAAFHVDHTTPPIEQNAYYLAAAYYGWHFSPDPSCWLWGTTTC